MKQWVELLQKQLAPLLNKSVVMSFSKHSFPVRVVDIYRARLVDLRNKPEPRIDRDGNTYTPAVLVLDCGEEKIYLYAEDIRRIVPRIDGLLIDMYSVEITFKWS